MYLVTRRVVVKPAHVRAGMAQAVDLLQYVNEKTELDASLYQVLQGAPLGTLVYAFRTESYSASVEATDPLTRSDAYLEKVEKAAPSFVGNAEDELAEFVHIAGKVGEAPAAASIVTATVEVSRTAAAVAWSIELANYLHNLTALPNALLSSISGRYGRLSWLAYASSLSELEIAGSKTRSDPGLVQRLADAEGLFIPGSAESSLSRRLA